jgi:hypothetical protein
MGGVFSSYGMDFLDVLNETVNTNPPAEFDIYYRQSDDKIGSKLRSDWLYDFSRPIGMIEIAALWVIAIIINKTFPPTQENEIPTHKRLGHRASIARDNASN